MVLVFLWRDMHLYIHKIENKKETKINDIKDRLFEKSLNNYLASMGIERNEWKIETAEHGKPYFADIENLHFSISHSGHYWTCLFDGENIGVDIEDYRLKKLTNKRIKSISGRYFKPDEQEYIFQVPIIEVSENDSLEEYPDIELKKRFFEIWTAKEAYIKYTGNGFSEGFQSFSVLDNSLNLFFQKLQIEESVILTFCTTHSVDLADESFISYI